MGLFRPSRNSPPAFAARIPGVSALAELVRRIAAIRVGRTPVGLFALLPVALFLDAFDVFDEFAVGPVGMALSFVLETAFVLGLTGRTGYALGFAGIDLIPGVDVIPFATLTLVMQIREAMREDAPHAARRDGPVIDV